MATVYIPTPLRRLTGGKSKVEVEATTVEEAILVLDEQFPGIAEKVLDDDGKVKRFINVFLNDDEIRTLQGLGTPIADKDRVSIVPAMAGGARTSVIERAGL
jgi:molybdopterin synthase sulfur carrier subunit